MKIRITNNKSETVKVVLEPWATEYDIVSKDYIDFISTKSVSENEYFNVESSHYGLVVTHEGKNCVVYAFDSNGELID